jgi:hypothetical protein
MNDEMIVQEGAVEEPRDTNNESERALMGKIARLPKAIREQVNRRIEDGQPASVMVPWLNELPQVRKVMGRYFGGAEINHRNISNWRASGYQRWLEKQERLAELKELAEDAKDYCDASGKNLARGMASLAAAKILKMLKELPPEKCSPAELTRIAFAVAALVQGEQNYVRLKYEQTRVYQGNERLVLSWDKHMRGCVAIAQRVLEDQLAKDIQDADIDNGEKIELLGHHLFGHKWHGRKVGNKEEPENGASNGEEGSGEPSPHPDPLPSHRIGAEREQPGDSVPGLESQRHIQAERPAKVSDAAQHTRVVRSNTVSDETQDARVMRPTEVQVSPAVVKESAEKKKGPGLIGRIGRIFGSGSKRDAGGSTGQPVRDSSEGNAATGAVALPVSVGERKNNELPAGQPDSKLKIQNSTPPKPPLSDYEKARLEGKSHLEAMYAQFSPAKNPPPPRAPIPLDPFPDPVLAYRCIMSRQDPLRPAPGFNSLG